MPSALNLSSSKPALYTGVSVYNAPENSSIVDNLHIEKYIDARYQNYSENEYIVIKEGGQSALVRYKNGRFCLIDQKYLDKATAIKPRNKEQYFALDALLDDAIKVVTLTGIAGSGKTLLALAAILSKIENQKYRKVILSKPMSQVGSREFGILPGDAKEKIHPYLINYQSNLECLFGEKSSDMETIFERYNIEVIPLQFIRGASFNKCLVVVDECQTLNHHEMLTLGTRISEGSKLIIMGDLNQRDEPIAKERTGLFKFINDNRVKDSKFTASIHMLKSERGEVASLFSTVFE